MENQSLGELQINKVQTIYENILISKCGRVFSKDHIKHSVSRGNAPYSCLVLGRELRLRKDKDGYLRFNTSVDGRHKTLLVHRLMALTFFEEPKKDKVVDHIDRDKTNNCIENLRYASFAENIRNSSRHKMTQEKKIMAIKMRNIGASIALIARALNVHYGSIKFFLKTHTEGASL